MTGLAPVALALAGGWGLWRVIARAPGAPGALAGSTLGAVLLTVAWTACLDAVGLPWRPLWLLLPLPPALAAGLAWRRHVAVRADRDVWAGVAAAAVAARALVAALTPAFGWDFRYLWGLKARVFALAGGFDLGWLAWPGHRFAHPGYPPAWSDLIAAGIVLGAPADAVAAAWQALLAAALAAVCWEVTARRPGWLRALAASAAAWSPVLCDPRNSGYAEPLLAFLAALALASLAGAARGERGALATVTAAAAALALTKNEGIALAAGVCLALLLTGGIRRAWPPLAAAGLAVAAWRLVLPAGVAGAASEFAPSVAAAARNAAELPSALLSALSEAPLLALVMLLWAVCLASWWVPELRGVRLAVAVWGAAVGAAYLSTVEALAWHVASSLDRVLAAPLPAVLALVLAASFTPPERRAAPP